MANVTFVTGNAHKAQLLEELLGFPIKYQSASVDEIQALNIEEVGKHKATQAYEIIQSPVLIDDFGTSFEALDGLPGAFTKFFVDAKDGLEMMCRMLDSFPSRAATVSSVMVYFDGTEHRVFRGSVCGHIVDHPRGSIGIGTDYIFAPDGYGGRTRAELTKHEYDEVYRRVRPIDSVREFLESIK